MSSLEVAGLRKSFGDKDVLTDISFRVADGDITTVIGPSGCGKTTLFRCILGEVEPDSGRVLVADQDVTELPVRKRGVGIVYQGYALFPHLTVGENVAYGLRARKADAGRIRERTREMLELVQLGGREDERPTELSGGEKQRVALARALAVQPRILLLDEAFAALDATTRTEVVQEIRRIIRRVKLTTLLITHDQEEAFLFSKNVLVLNDGRIVTQGTPQQVMAHEHPFIQGFVRMVHLSQNKVEADGDGRPIVTLAGGQPIPLKIPGIEPGDRVQVMVKKSPKGERIEVWPDDEP